MDRMGLIDSTLTDGTLLDSKLPFGSEPGVFAMRVPGTSLFPVSPVRHRPIRP